MREWTPFAVLLLALSLPAQVLDLAAARLEGQVVDPQHRPVPGAAVVAEVDGEVVARTCSDAQGTFVFGKLPQQVVVVRATTKAPDVGGNWVDLLGLERGFVRLVTMPARKVSGTVRDDQGQPVAGAFVLSAPNDAIEFAHATCFAVSAADGGYELSHVPFGPVLVRAWAEGHDAFEGDADGTGDVRLDCTVERDAGQVHTFRLVDATPAQLAAATLAVQATHRNLPVPLPPPLRRLRAGADGTWTVRGWPYVDDVHVRVVLPGISTAPCAHTALADRGGCKRQFSLADAATSLRGRLAGAADTPVGGRLLLVQPAEGNPAPWRRVLGRSAADGTFTLPCPVDRDERFALRVADGMTTVDGAEPPRAWFLAAHGSTPHTVPVEPARRIRLRVLAADRTPVHGAAVALVPALAQPTAVAGLAEPQSAQGAALALGTSDLDGRVDIAGLWLQTGERLVAVVTSPAGCAQQVFLVEQDATTDLGAVVLGAAVALTGQCVDDDGKPLAGRRITLTSRRRVLAMSVVTATDRDGRFAVPGLLPGSYAVFLRDGQGAASQQALELTEPTTAVTLR